MNKILRIKQLFLYLFLRRLVWKTPNRCDVLVLGSMGSERLKKSLNKDVDCCVFKDDEEIYTKQLIMAIFSDYKFNTRKIILNYYLKVIYQFMPKLIITNNDNSPFYWKLDKIISNDIIFLTVQNGTHLLGMTKNVPSCYQLRFLDRPPYYSNLICISKFDFDYYKKFGAIIDKCSPIGSLLISSYITGYIERKRKYDICIVAGVDNSRVGEKIMLEYVLSYMKINQVSVCVTLKESCCTDAYQKNLIEFSSIVKHGAVLIERNGNSSHCLSDSSEVTIGHGTTFLRQTFARGNKIYPMNFIDSSMDPPYDILGYSLSPSYKEFELHLNYLLKVNGKKYNKINKKNMKYLDASEKNDTPHQKLNKIIQKLLVK